MFSTVDMSRLTVAAPVDKMEEVLRIASDSGAVHIQNYEDFEHGITVGNAISSEEANHVAALLSKVRAAASHYSPVNTKGPSAASAVKKMISGDFEKRVDAGLAIIDSVRDAEQQLASKSEQLSVLERIAPLDIPLELLTSSKHVEVYVAETAKAFSASKGLGAGVQVHAASGVVAIACTPDKAAEVQIILAEFGAKAIQVPSGEGRPGKVISNLQSEVSALEAKIESEGAAGEAWAEANGRDVVLALEYLTREDAIYTAPTLCAVSNQAFAIDAWVPTTKAESVKASLSGVASHVHAEEFVDDHHHHHDDDDHGHAHVTPPIEFDNVGPAQSFELMVDLVGRPAYGSFDPSLFIMLTFPMVYGLILGDFGYGLIIAALGFWLGSKPFAADPVAQKGITILKWMGVWCIIWGLIFAEGFGFVWDNSAAGNSPFSFLHPLYDWTYANIHFPAFVTDAMNMSHLTVPWHRASAGHGLEEYVLISVYLGAAHLMIGFIIGFVNVMKAHGIVAAFFEKGSWIIILTTGFIHIYGFLTGSHDVLAITPAAMGLGVGLVCLIIGLAHFEKFGAAGGLIMGPIETFGLLANTLSYLRIMGVGVAGVKIAEVSISMGWELMLSGIEEGAIFSIILGIVLFVFIQAFALALGILSPSIHAARLHFVEWMGKFYDGSGVAFAPLGGRTLHVEG